jgi:hypothetical protein
MRQRAWVEKFVQCAVCEFVQACRGQLGLEGRLRGQHKQDNAAFRILEISPDRWLQFADQQRVG